jgi:hypothetical protein
MALIDKPDRARQAARGIVSDILVYHDARIVDAIEKDNLFDAMHAEIEEGRTYYKRRVTPEMFALNHYDRALVDVMLKAKGHVKSRIW